MVIVGGWAFLMSVELEPLDPRSVERGGVPGAEPVDFTPCVIPTVLGYLAHKKPPTSLVTT